MTLSTFVEPFFEGGAISEAVPDERQVSIAGHGYIIEPTKYRRSFVTQLRVSQDQQTEPGEHTINPEAIWRRSRSTWFAGAGQTYLDSPGSTAERFRESKWIDPWKEHALTLLPACGSVKAAVSVNAAVRVVNGPDDVYLLNSDGSTDQVNHSTGDLSSWANCTGLSGQVWGIATDGINVYVVAGAAGTTKVYSTTLGSTVFTALTGSAAAYVGVAYANGRLFAWKTDGTVHEIASAGTATVRFTHRLGSQFTITAILGTPKATLICGHAGTTGEVYRMVDDTDTGGLGPGILAASIIAEPIWSACYENGLVALGVGRNEGGNVRIATLGDAGDLTLGPAVLVDDIDSPVKALWPGGRFIWFGWSDYDDDSTGLGRLDLQTATSALVPAYASDLMWGTDANQKTGQVTSITRFGSNMLFTVDGKALLSDAGNDNGAADADGERVGTLASGRIRFDLLDFKSFTSLDARWDPLPASTEVALSIVVDAGSPVTEFDISTDDSTGPTSPESIGGLIGEWCEITATLTADVAATDDPTLRWWVLRAVPTTGAIQKITVPIILRRKVRAGPQESRPYIDFDVATELTFLLSLVASRQVFLYQEGSRTDVVYMANLEQQAEQWDPTQAFLEGLVLVELRTLE